VKREGKRNTLYVKTTPGCIHINRSDVVIFIGPKKLYLHYFSENGKSFSISAVMFRE
jgi:hypothetical protein